MLPLVNPFVLHLTSLPAAHYALLQIVQCGAEQDFGVKFPVEGSKAPLSVQWYNGAPCGPATISVDFFCPMECTRRCLHQGNLDKATCRCALDGVYALASAIGSAFVGYAYVLVTFGAPLSS